jgi:membrane protease YdiL (CAAX protease family)
MRTYSSILFQIGKIIRGLGNNVVRLQRMNKSQPRFMSWALVIVVFLLLASYLLAMLLGPSLFFFTPTGLDFGKTSVQPLVFILLFFGFTVPFELKTVQLFMFSWGIFVLCFVVAWRLRENFHEVVGKISSRPLSKIFDNWLFIMPIIASALFVGVLLLIGIQDLFKVPTGALPTPQTDTEVFDLYLSISYAPMIEEIGFRITPIGGFLLVYLFIIKTFENRVALSSWQRFKLFAFSFLYPDGAKSIVGEKTVAVNGFRGISRGEWIMILITSIMFGIAHILSGIGWEIGKVTSTFIQGFVFAIVYLAYGFQAPILMHWFFNYYFYTYQVSAKYYANTLETFAWIEFITLILGVLSLIGFAILGLKKISNRRKTTPQSPSTFSP